jgi:hypothetical protein
MKVNFTILMLHEFSTKRMLKSNTKYVALNCKNDKQHYWENVFLFCFVVNFSVEDIETIGLCHNQ